MSSPLNPGPEQPGDRRPVGATSVTGEPARRRRWPLLLLLLVVLAMLLLISWCNASDATAADPLSATTTTATGSATSTGSITSTSSSGSASPSSVATNQAGAGPTSGSTSGTGATGTTDTAAAAAAAAPAGTVSSGGTVIIGTGSASTTETPTALAPFVGKPATAKTATVQSVPADEGFWVGTSDANRVWVQMTGSGESAQTIRAGDHVSFVGTVAANSAGFADQVGVDATEGADQLTAQGAHVEVAKTGLTLSR